MQRPIFMIGWEFPPHNSGGLGVACEGLTRGLSGLGHQVVFTLPQAMGGGRAPQVQNYTHQSGSCMKMVYVDSPLQPYLRAQWDATKKQSPAQRQQQQQFFTDMVSEAKKYGETVGKIAKEYPHDVIHAHDWMSIPAGIAAKKRTHKPLVVQIHSTEYDRSGGYQPHSQIADIEYQGMEAADKIVAVSNYTKQMLQDFYHISGEKIEVVHNGIDPNPEFHSQVFTEYLQDRYLVVFVGRLTIQKGPEYFLSVAKEVIAREPKAVFVLAGDGDMYQHLLVSAAQQGLSGSVLFAGFLRGKEKTQLFRRADVFVMPSVSEPFGIVALEAALEDTPVIVSKTSGVSEVMPNAVAIDFWDVHKMRDAVVSLLHDESLRKQQARVAKDLALQQTWQKAAGEMDRIYQSLVGA